MVSLPMGVYPENAPWGELHLINLFYIKESKMNKIVTILFALLLTIASAMIFSAASIGKDRAAVLNAVSVDDPALCNVREPDCG